MTILNPNSSPSRKRGKNCVNKVFTVKTLKKRVPIIEWLPKYKFAYVIQDMIAGITVALTAIPQGIAFAVIAGLSPEYGMYASLTSGVVYVFFGSCYNLTVGPTAILAALTAKYVADYSPDFAILAAFISGVLILLMGVLQLGFLVEFISKPVISGFMGAASLQIAASQLKALFGVDGSSGNYFAESITNFIVNIKTIRVWNPVLGFGTIVMLILLKKMGHGCKRIDGFVKQMRWFTSLSRNAVVVVVGMILAYILKVTLNEEPFVLIGDIGVGLPTFRWPPFATTAGNVTLSFGDMLQILGTESIVIPFVTILETVAISKAFAEGGRIDATQEMIAIGLCNIIGSFGQSMPITGSFARTAINHYSGVVTPAGGVTKVLLIVVALTYLTSTFYYIPRASLAALIITALFSMFDYPIMYKLWRNSKSELLIMLITLGVCLYGGLEYGVIAGIIIEAAMSLYNVSRPTIKTNIEKCEKGDLLIVSLPESLSYCAAEHVRRAVSKASLQALPDTIVIIDGSKLLSMDFTATSNMISAVTDLEKNSYRILLLNFNIQVKKLCVDINRCAEGKFVYATNALELPNVFTKE